MHGETVKFTVMCSTNHCLHTYSTRSQCEHSSKPWKYLEVTQFLAMFVEAFPDRLPLHVRYFSLKSDPNLEFYLRTRHFLKIPTGNS